MTNHLPVRTLPTMDLTRHLTSWLLLTLALVFAGASEANWPVMPKTAPGIQNFKIGTAPGKTLANPLTHRAKLDFSTTAVSGSPLATKSTPTLKSIHSKETLTSGSNKYSYDHWSKQSTDDIVRSLKPGEHEALRIKPDGRIWNGNTRTTILRDRGFDINSLPREVLHD